MATMTVVLTEATPLNGCMYVLPGSHEVGRTNPRWDDLTAYKLWVAKTGRYKGVHEKVPRAATDCRRRPRHGGDLPLQPIARVRT